MPNIQCQAENERYRITQAGRENAVCHTPRSRPFYQLSIMNGLTIFGLIAVALMLLFYSLEHRSPGFVLAFAGSCLMGSAYGFLQGAWPFGAVELVWAFVAFRRWWHA
jgi:hypothetical protein